MNPDIFSDIFNVNVIAGFEFAKHLSNKKYMDSQGASFIFISSVMGFLGESGRIGYSSSKAAIIGGVKSMALELARKKIRVNSVSPAMVKTKMLEEMFDTLLNDTVEKIITKHPLGIGNIEDVSNACAFLLSDLSKWITGTNLIVDGGYSAQ